jgi:5'-nucleotidase
MMKILVTNDDGIDSPGLHALAQALRVLGDVWVVAPDRERTAVAHALTLHKPLRLNRLQRHVFSVNGTPSDCVNLALKKVLPAQPALIVSGINRGVNLGDDVTYSGTVSAALEGTILGIPSIAVSQESGRGGGTFRFDVAAAYAVRVARVVLIHGLPAETLVNVNVPDRPKSQVKGVKVTSLSRRWFHDPIVEKVDPHGRKYYWIAGTRVSWERRKDADHEAVRRGFVSVTPIHLDITNYGALDQLRQWEPMLTRQTGPKGTVKKGAGVKAALRGRDRC